MIWEECYLHVAFALSGIVLMFLNFVGGFSFLLVKRYEGEGKLGELAKTVIEVRGNLNFVYLVLSFIFMLLALILGFIKAQNAWKTFFDFKIFTTLIIVFYLLFASLITTYRRIKKKPWQRHLAFFNIFNIFLIILSLASNLFSTHHKYLKFLF